MKHIYSTFLVALIYTNLNAQDLLLGRGGWLWDTASVTFKPQDSVQNVYDLNRNLIQTVNRRFGNPNPGVWNFTSKKDYTYDGLNQNTEIFEFVWNSSAWQNYKHETFEYDTSGNVKVNILQNYTGSTFQNEGKLEYVYVDGKTTDFNYYSWSAGAWNPTTWWQYHYNGDGLRDTSLVYLYISNTWSLFTRYIYTYNAQGLVTSTLIQDWNSGSWVNDFIDNTTYNAQGKTVSYYRGNWGGVLWNWDKKWQYTYQNDLYLTNMNVFDWNGLNFSWYLTDSTSYHLDGNNLCDYEVQRLLVGSSWENEDSVLHWYDAHHNLIHNEWHVWKTHLNNWQPYHDNYWWYLLGTSSGVDQLLTNPVKVYPNPASETLQVEFTTTEPQMIEATLINLNGQLAKPICRKWEAPGLVKLTADVKELSAGIYFLQIKVGDKTLSKKVILE